MTGSGPPAVELRGVSKRYGVRRPVLEDVNLTVLPADIVAVTGVNGSGKSTLLRLIARLSLPSAGQLTHAARVIGYVPERFPSQDWLPAHAYLRHMARIRGLSADAATRRIDDLMDLLKLGSNRSVAMRKLSKGNAQKVALAQAVLTAPDLLVLDEPWSGLDASVHDTLRELMDRSAAEGAAVIFTDHREAVVSATATRVCTIDGGRLSEKAAAAPAPSAAVAMLACFTRAASQPESAEPFDWRAVPGVLDVGHRPDQVEVLVSRESHDDLLVRAIAAGWSVASVVPARERAAPLRREPR